MPSSAIASPSSTSTSTPSCVGRDLAGALGEEGGVGDVGGQALQVAGAVGAVGGGGGDRQDLGGPLLLALGDAVQQQLLGAGAGLVGIGLALEPVEAVGGEDRGAGEGGCRGGAAAGHLPGQRRDLVALRLADAEGGGDAEPLGVELLALAEADDEHALGVASASAGRSIVSFLKPARTSPAPGASASQSGRSSPSKSAEAEQLGGRLGGGDGVEGDLHGRGSIRSRLGTPPVLRRVRGSGLYRSGHSSRHRRPDAPLSTPIVLRRPLKPCPSP